MSQRGALVTGASKGIGRAIAGRLLDTGWRVIGLSRTAPEDLLDHDGYHHAYADLLDPGALQAALDEILASEAGLDTLVNCAGAGWFGSLEQHSPRHVLDILQLNLNAPILITRKLLPAFKTRKRGDLLFIGSETALRGGRYGAVYTAAKTGLRGFTRALREETASAGIRVMLINPGMVRSNFYDHTHFTPGKHEDNAIKPEQIADAALLALDSARNCVIDEINLTPLKRVVEKKG